MTEMHNETICVFLRKGDTAPVVCRLCPLETKHSTLPCALKHYSTDFHCQSIQEMLRVAKEVRILPLLTFEGWQSAYVNAVCEWLDKSGRSYQVQTADYEFHRGGNQMLHIRSSR